MPRHRPARPTPTASDGSWSSARLALLSSLGLWALYLALVSVRVSVSMSADVPHPLRLMERHALVAALGTALMWALYRLLLLRLEGAPVGIRVAAALGAVAPLALFLSQINYDVLFVLAPGQLWPPGTEMTPRPIEIVAHSMVENYLLLATWATLYTAVSGAVRTQDALRRAALSDAEARTAQLRALRYQLDPHFLFNALNTLSALVMRGDLEGAERTIEALSAFLRATLTLDALDDVPLRDELLLQTLYLAVEQVRYGDRLRVEVSVPDAVQDALVPVLLLQPLVENAIRHAVARVGIPVRLSLRAEADGALLRLAVEDDAPGRSENGGTGLGLRNVAARLSARFGARASCRFGPRPGGGFGVGIALPLRYGTAA